MPKSRNTKKHDPESASTEPGAPSDATPASDTSGVHEAIEAAAAGIRPPGTTGRYLVLMQDGASAAGVHALRRTAGLRVAMSSDFEDHAADVATLGGADVLMLEKLGVAVVDAPAEQIQAMRTTAQELESVILAVEPERIVHPVADPIPGAPNALGGLGSGVSLDYLIGYRDAVNELVEKILAGSGAGDHAAAVEAMAETELTWGLQATRGAISRFTGRGIRIAVLDTGMDLGHPDFAGRRIVSKSFVAKESVQDAHGHGTHCIGSACGPKVPGRLPRYGVAYNADIYAGKVLGNQGGGDDGSILAGIEWAVNNGCQIVSMSLGAPVDQGQSYSRVFEKGAQRALAAGTILIAAAGNFSQRPSLIAAVGHPANCPSILAVAAVDSAMRIASFSCGGLNAQGGQVDIAGPGVQILSSYPRPTLYKYLSGTSQATPHVAGIAALHAEARGARGAALSQILMQTAQRLSLSSRDVGAGLVQAP